MKSFKLSVPDYLAWWCLVPLKSRLSHNLVYLWIGGFLGPYSVPAFAGLLTLEVQLWH
jgi:hypothetical protein